MPAPMKLGSVLGGRYQVVADLLATAEGDHVLEGKDQILGRRVSILLPAERHTPLLVENARSMAGGGIGAPFQILDLGQAGDHTYLVTSRTPAEDMLEVLLVEPEDLDDESLGDDIFGAPRGSGSAAYVYDEPEPTGPAPVVAGEPSGDLGAAPAPKVTRWRSDDSYDDAAPAPSVRTRLGRPVRVSPASTRSTLFDRAAGGGTAAVTGRAAGIDPDYDGDNRYDSWSEEREEAPTAAPPAPPRDEDDRKGGRGLLLLLFLLLALLIGAVAFSFDRLGGLFDGGATARPAASAPAAGPASAQPTPSGAAGAPAPEAAAVTRVVPGNPGFMADQDAQLGQAVDGNPATYWTSYGFSDQDFGRLVPSVGLAVRLEQPAPVQTLRLSQSSGSGGRFDVYVNDAPTLEGAQQVGSGSFTGPQITVPLAPAAQEDEHAYVIVDWTQLPQLTNPIGGFGYGLRIGEIGLG